MARFAAAERYAKALFQLAKDQGNVPAIRSELRALGSLLEENDELRDVLLQPLHPAAQRRAVLTSVTEQLSASSLLKNFYSFLIDQRRLVDFAAIEEAYGELADADAGLTKAQVRTAAPLSDDQRTRLQNALGVRAGGNVELEVEIDPGLLGGVVAQIGDTVYDGSLKSQLQQLRASLAKG
ncbi:MAG: F0F1 ATP synthase subunit delta [Deltaproteobacteria bacterium]|nr:F0F1 ATP synthase subunit delta [Deltaproteobacteria bacterium]MBW2394518.1 F0F1 ATP synthase subunit delta [Deltaproteobacteria bacterium]